MHEIRSRLLAVPIQHAPRQHRGEHQHLEGAYLKLEIDQALDQRVEQRLNTLVAFARAVAHELGGTMLPSRKRSEAAAEPDNVRRLRFQLELLSDHIVSIKQGLDLFRSGTGGMEDTLDTQAWWELMRPLLKGAAGGKTQVLFSDRSDAGPVGADFTRCVTLVVIALVEQIDGLEQIAIELEGRPEAMRLRVAIDGGRPRGRSLSVPTALRQCLRSEPEVDDGGSRLSFDLGAGVVCGSAA